MKRLAILLFASLMLAQAQAADLGGIQATAIDLAGFLDGQALLGGLTAADAADGQATASGTLFALTADALRIETDSRPVVAVAGAHVPRDPVRTTDTYSGAELRAVQGHPGHQFTVLPSGLASLRLQDSAAALTPQGAARMDVEHFVDEDRPPMGADVPRAVRVEGLSDATLRIDGNMTLAFWYWDCVVQEGDRVTSYRTGYDDEQGASAPVLHDMAGHGQRVQAYVYATNATLTIVPDAAPLDLRILRPTFQGVTTVTAATATGRLAGTVLLSDELELRGDAMDVALEHVHTGLLQFNARGVETFRVDGGQAEVLAASALQSDIAPLPVLIGVLAVAAATGGVLFVYISPRRRLAVAAALLRRRRRWLARLLLRPHLRWTPDCVEGLTLLAKAEAGARRPAKELDVRLRAAKVLVDDDRIQNARRILHLYARLGRDVEALSWFEACKRDDPGLVQEMMYEPSFRSIDQRLRARARHALGWDDPTGA